jgi:hypothetical protein
MAAVESRLGHDSEATAWAAKTLDLAPGGTKARIRLGLAGYAGVAGPIVRTAAFWPDEVPMPEGDVVPALRNAIPKRHLLDLTLSEEN